MLLREFKYQLRPVREEARAVDRGPAWCRLRGACNPHVSLGSGTRLATEALLCCTGCSSPRSYAASTAPRTASRFSDGTRSGSMQPGASRWRTPPGPPQRGKHILCDLAPGALKRFRAVRPPLASSRRSPWCPDLPCPHRRHDHIWRVPLLQPPGARPRPRPGSRPGACPCGPAPV